MRKFIMSCIILVLCNLSLNAQVGINTNNPEGIFDIDVQDNNLTTNTTVSLKDDVLVTVNSNNEASVVIGGDLVSGSNSSLELNATDKSLLLNRIPLTSSGDITTVNPPQRGMLVYNTNTSASTVQESQKVSPGLYLYMGDSWNMLDRVSAPTNGFVNIRELAGTANARQTTGVLTNISTGAGATTFTTRIPGETTGSNLITIDQTGRYLFIFRWYGLVQGGISGTIINDNDFYVYIFKSGGSAPLVSSLVKPWLGNGNSPTVGANASATTIVATPFLQQGDQIDIRMGGTGTSGQQWGLVSNVKTMANRTSFVYFKIQ